MKENRKQLRFNVAFVLLLVGLFVMVFLSFSIVNGNNSYSQFTHILQSLYGDGGNAGATATQSSENLATPSSFSSPPSYPPYSSSSLPDVFQKVENSVVQITSTTSNPNEIIIDNGVPATGKSTALGSGFVYDGQGHIVTNYHVINGATRADVTFTDGNTYSANVVGKDSNSDIAVLQISSNFSEENVKPIPLANSSAVRPGEQVLAIGNPFGLSGTITTGIVSAKGRLLPDPDTGFSLPNMIQTDAAVNPGNSGGPLLNSQGQVIGMNTAIFSSTGVYSGVGFAIPSNMIAKEAPMIIKDGTYNDPWLGISGGKITPDLTRAMGLVIVASVSPDSPADKAGLKGLDTQDDSSSGATLAQPSSQTADIITAIDGHLVRQIDDIINYIECKNTKECRR
jgi:S1-C subfamily serine protease